MEVAHRLKQELQQLVDEIEEVAEHNAVEPLAVLAAVRISMEARALKRCGIAAPGAGERRRRKGA